MTHSETPPPSALHSPLPYILTIPEALRYQKELYGRIVFGRDALYAVARAGRVPVVRVGQHRILFPRTSIDLLLSGRQAPEELME